MEENVAYDEGPVREVDYDERSTARRRKPKEEEIPAQEELEECTKAALRISTVDTISGLYALLLLSLGFAFPVSEYTSPEGDTSRRDAMDTGFELYVFVLSLAFQIYMSIKTRLIKRKSSRHEYDVSWKPDSDPTFVKANVYVVGDDIKNEVPQKANRMKELNRTVPWHQWHKVAPPVYHTKFGLNIFTRLGIIVFGASAVAVEICRMVDYAQNSHSHCRYAAKIALIVIRMLFILNQSLYLFIHHKVVFNFQHPLIKFALLHMIGANLIMWIKTVARDSVETYALLSDPDKHILANTTDTHQASEPNLEERFCLSYGNAEYRASNYLAPLVIEYCVLAASLLYRQYCSVGPSIYINPPKPDIWDFNQEKKDKKNRIRVYVGIGLGLPLFLATLGITVWDMVLSDKEYKDMNTLLTQGRIFTACNLTWNIIILIALVPSFYRVNKLRYEAKPISHREHVMLFTLGGTFIFLGFVSVALFMMVNDPLLGFMARMGIPGALITFFQSVAMFVFAVDVFRRKVIDVKVPHGEGAVVFLIFANVSMWLVSSFQWKYSFGSFLFFTKFGKLPWVLILNSTLPLAMFYRFVICVVLMEVIRGTYGHRLF